MANKKVLEFSILNSYKQTDKYIHTYIHVCMALQEKYTQPCMYTHSKNQHMPDSPYVV